MLRIKQKNCKFKVDEEKRTVVCWIEGYCVRKMAHNFLCDHNIDIFGMRPVMGGMDKIKKIVNLPYRVTGIAVCSAEDEWNEELGRLIAFNKMKNKLDRLFLKHVQSCVSYIDSTLEKMIDAAEAFGRKSAEATERRNAAIENEIERNTRSN